MGLAITKFQHDSVLAEKTFQTATPSSAGWQPAIVLLLLLMAFVFLQCFLPLRTTIQIGGDEGFALAKATLYLNGYKLYSEVWNDQPPLHTFIISGVLKLLPSSILGPRLLTSIFTAILLASIFFIIVRVSGLLVASLTTGLLIASPGFVDLSSSCMVEIPALAPAITALCLLIVVRHARWPITEIAAGILFGVALQIKFNAAVYLLLAGLILRLHVREAVCRVALRSRLVRREKNVADGRTKASSPSIRFSLGKRIARSVLLFAASMVVAFVAVGCVVGESGYLLQFKQAWSAHVASVKSFEYGSPNDYPFDWSVLLKNWDTSLPAILGAILSVRQARKTPLAILPLAWLALSLIVFASHKPWWPYYYIHTAIPLCWCAAIGVGAAWKNAKAKRTPALVALLAVYALCAGAWMVSRMYLQIATIRHSPQTYSSLVLKQIDRMKPFTKFIYTDEPIYSFHAGIPMPPNLAFISLKRLWSGDLTTARISAEFAEVKPELILLKSTTNDTPINDLIAAEYRLIYEDASHRLYARKSVSKNAGL